MRKQHKNVDREKEKTTTFERTATDMKKVREKGRDWRRDKRLKEASQCTVNAVYKCSLICSEK